MSVSEFGRASLSELLTTIGGQYWLGRRLLENLRASGWQEDPGGQGTPNGFEPIAGAGEEAMQHLLRCIQARVPFTHVVLGLLDTHQAKIESLWSMGFGSAGRDREWLAERWSDLARVLDGETLVVEDIGFPHVENPSDAEGTPQPGSLVVLPIPAGGSPVGFLTVGNAPARSVSAGEKWLLKNAAFVLGHTILEISVENEGREILYAMTQSLAAALDARDAYTRGHSDRVAMYAMAIANELEDRSDSDLPGRFRDQLRLAAVFHDIGKIGIRDDILLKPAALTDREYAEIKKHSLLGAEIIKTSGVLDYIIPGVLYHHERHDGSGYPVGLKGDEIPDVARIIGLADAFDAMISDRNFRPGIPQSEAIEILKKSTGSHFTSEVVDALVRAYEKGLLASVRAAPAGAAHRAEDEIALIDKTFSALGDSIPSLPAVVSKLSEIVRDPDCSVSDISKILSTDEGLVAQVLRIANSAFYALPGRVGTIPLAITILGINTLRNLVIGTAMADLTRQLAGSPEVAEKLWDHGVDVGVWCRWIARKMGGVDPEEAFTAGLLHDVGKGLVLQSLPKDRERVKWRLLEGGDSNTIENEVLGFDHAQLGGWAATRWRLPRPLSQAVRWHHQPSGVAEEKPEVERLVGVVHVSDILAWAGEGDGIVLEDVLARKADPLVLKNLPIRDPSTIEELLVSVKDGIDEARQLFSEMIPISASND